MVEEIDGLKETEKAKLNAAFELEQDTLKVKQDSPAQEQGASCAGMWGIPLPLLLVAGMFLFFMLANWQVGWWIVPLVFFLICKAKC
jgi:hypothetical protein